MLEKLGFRGFCCPLGKGGICAPPYQTEQSGRAMLGPNLPGACDPQTEYVHGPCVPDHGPGHHVKPVLH